MTARRIALAAFLTALWFGASVRAREIVALEIVPLLEYRDLSTSCSNTALPRVMRFEADVTPDDTVRRAMISRDGDSPTKKIELASAVAAAIELHRDVHGRAWIRRLPADASLIFWFFFHSSNEVFASCRPPMRLISVSPALVDFDFSIDTVQEVPGYSVSPSMKFHGRRVDGSLYESALGFEQRQRKDRT